MNDDAQNMVLLKVRIFARDIEQVERNAHVPSADGIFEAIHITRLIIFSTAAVDHTNWSIAYSRGKFMHGYS